MNIGENNDVLFARLDDLCRYARRGVLGSSCFLSPRELHFARKYLKRNTENVFFVEWGGYHSAERKKIFILPDYMEGVSEYSEMFEYGYEGEITALLIKGSGYKALSHRDFLGSVLGLGIERSSVGDICLIEDKTPSAVLFCEKKIAPFILDELKKVGSDTVKIGEIDVDPDFSPVRNFSHISDTVASARTDAVVAALCSLSRERAREVVCDGLVEVEYEMCEQPDRQIVAPCVISVRGYGKFRINSVSEQTKKGRFRLDADKYV